MDQQTYSLPFDAFVRSFSMSAPHALLLGAGCSISSGLPSAQQCIWDWKKQIYLSRNRVSSPCFDVRQESTKKIIQDWLDRTGEFPPAGDASEYELFVEYTFPIEQDRREYFAKLCRTIKPSIGYKVLITLFQEGKVSSIWTTNFDNLAIRAAHQANVSNIEINIDTADQIYRHQIKDDLLYVALHGDYKYSKLKNTSTELDSQVEIFEQALKRHLVDNNLVVIGYSGRDKSLMNALKKAYSQSGSGRLYWCGYGSELSPTVKELIDIARKNGREAFYVDAPGFDEAIVSLAEFCFQDNMKAIDRINSLKAETNQAPSPCVPVNLPAGPLFNTKLKLNLYPLIVPKRYYQIDCSQLSETFTREMFRECMKRAPFVAIMSGTKILAFGQLENLVKHFHIDSLQRIKEVPVPSRPLEDPMLKHLIIKAILWGLSQRSPSCVVSYSDKILWNSVKKYQQGFEGVKINVLSAPNNGYLLVSFSPTLMFLREHNVAKSLRQDQTRRYIDTLRNPKFQQKISEWETELLYGERCQWSFNDKPSKDDVFSLGGNSAFCGVLDNASSAPKFTLGKREIWAGKNIVEPGLLFSDKAGTSFWEHPNPMKGLVSGRPLDYLLSPIGHQPIYLGVICPISYTQKLYDFLVKLNQACSPQYQDYTQPYPGFQEAYSTNLDIPHPSDNFRWISCKDTQSDASTLASHICEFSQKMSQSYPNYTIIIFIPEAWEHLKEQATAGQTFNLHNYVKTYGAQSHITTQFIEEKTLTAFMDCEKRWWLSLALFVKGQRTPWSLANLDPHTAYAGIGYSIDSTHERGKQIVIGCSHLYNAHGQGLKYRLRQIDNPLWIDRKSPYLSENEAYKFGLSILDLFRDAMERFPNRVVIHKRTPFQQTEINGLKKALLGGGVKNIDLISITEEPNIKGISQISNGTGILTDNYPVQRGTCIQISDNEVLLWTHGTVPSVIPGRRYYAGGKAIPNPIRIRRCYGDTEIEVVASEILSFTKMDWNTFNFYSKMPATISTSNVVAQVGKLLSHYPNHTFDYRFFI